ncbi:GNAT family protein [Brucella sp. TWI432]|nr:GNAT family N-acetyltransferase [Brucella sp. 21LCYQ03]
MSLEFDHSRRPKYRNWAAEKIGISNFRPDAVTITAIKNGEITAVTVFDTFSDNDCQIHVASDGSRNWLSRQYLHMVFAYPFQQLRFRRLTSLISVNNHASLAFCKQTGFAREGLLRKAAESGEDLVLFGMLREECRWLPLF